MTKQEHIILVDQNDNAIGTAEKIQAHKEGALHRAFSVFIYKKQKDSVEILLQQRHPDKYHAGNLWTNTCCGHPRPDEKTQQAAERRLFEEFGIRSSLKEIGVFQYRATFENGLTEHEIDHVFINKPQDHDYVIAPNPVEIIDYKWISIDDLKTELQHSPEKYTPWFQQALEIFLSTI
ncbi:MAG: isopentenyl-diphosphate Delta-isomerase [Gammaproteobacteria bacterium]